MRQVQDRRPLRTLIAVAAVVVAVDHLTKWWAQRALVDHDIHIVSTLRLHLTYNNGAAFSVGSRFTPVIALFAVALVVALLGFGRGLQGRLPTIAVGAIVGGAVGNLVDRVVRDGSGFLGGAVVDFIDVQWWPVFNVADTAITLGVIALALTAGRQ